MILCCILKKKASLLFAFSGTLCAEQIKEFIKKKKKKKSTLTLRSINF